MALAAPPPQTLLVFGGSGDLARRKLLPAVYDLAYEGLLPERYAIVGSGGSRLDDAGFRERARGAVEEFSRHRLDEGRWQAFARGLSYVSAPLDDPDAFGPLRDHLVALDAELGAEGRRLLYCGTPPSAFPTIVRRTGEGRLGQNAEIAQAVAVMAVAIAVVFVYRAAGGSFGLAGAEPGVPWAMQASRAAGAVIAVVGLLGLAGRWGQQTRFWLPAALTWVGSGALVAFDGFWLMLNQLFVMFGTNASDAGWTLIDTVVAIKVLIGVLAAAVGALAITAAARGRGSGADEGELEGLTSR